LDIFPTVAVSIASENIKSIVSLLFPEVVSSVALAVDKLGLFVSLAAILST